MLFDKINVNDLKTRLWNLASDRSISVFEIETFLRKFFVGKPLPIVGILYKNYCRCSLNSKEEIFETVNRCSFNPKIEEINLQRCNYKKQQVFYAAVPTKAKINCTGTAITEVSWEHISDKFLDYYFLTLSRWVTKRPLKVFCFPDIKNQESQKINLEEEIKKTGTLNQQDIPYFLSVLKLFREILGIKEHKKTWYKVSSAFYNCVMGLASDENQTMDGMIYSSANSERLGTNIVLNKVLIDDYTIYCDYVQMWIAHRHSDPTHIAFWPVSDMELLLQMIKHLRFPFIPNISKSSKMLNLQT